MAAHTCDALCSNRFAVSGSTAVASTRSQMNRPPSRNACSSAVRGIPCSALSRPAAWAASIVVGMPPRTPIRIVRRLS